jgi:type VI secretion system protein ImpC
MSLSEGFLQAIWERPDDDAPRLAYADWLAERGDPQAEFIRIQIDLTRGDRDRHQELGLRRRERELLERFGAAWVEPVLRQGLRPWFRRGFRQPVERVMPAHCQPRPLRVTILYPWRVGALTLSRELPFVVGVLADLSGHRREGRPSLHHRLFLTVDRHSLDAVLARIRPELHLLMPGGFADRTLPQPLDLHFDRLADFEPARLVERVPELRALFQDRQRRAAVGAAPAELVALDRRLSEPLAALLHHPDFQRLESAWRGLHYLVQQAATSENLKIRVLDVARHELVEDLDPRRPLQDSCLFQKIYQQEYGHVDGEPYGLLVADYEFSHHAEDVQLLRGIGALGAAAHAPFVAGAGPTMFQRERFTGLPAPRALNTAFDGGDYAAWRSFRDSDDSRCVALTLPRVRALLPYGLDHACAGGLQFDEFADGPDHAKHLWMSAAWAYAVRITDAFARWGWFARTRGVEGGGRVENLPTGASPADDGSLALGCPTEIAISDRREFELSNLGFLPLLYNKDTHNAVFMGTQSCQKPKRYHDPAANANAELSAKLDLSMCVWRFGHYLKMMARDLLAASVPVEQCQHILSEWLGQYAWSAEEWKVIVWTGYDHLDCASRFRRPIADVVLKLRPAATGSGQEVVVTLTLDLQLDGAGPLHAVFPVARLGTGK